MDHNFSADALRVAREIGRDDADQSAPDVVAAREAYLARQLGASEASDPSETSVSSAAQWGLTESDGADGPDASDGSDASDVGPQEIWTPAKAYVRRYMEDHGLIVTASGNIEPEGGYRRMGDGVSAPTQILWQQEIERNDFIDDLIESKKSSMCDDKEINAATLRMAVKSIIRFDMNYRRVEILNDLLQPLTMEEVEKAEADWKLFAKCFDMPEEITIAAHKKMIHQVKKKQLRGEIERHTMVVYQSPTQGLGKTTCARRFLSPLQELFRGFTNLREVVDQRNISIFKRPVVLFDDIEKLGVDMAEVLKGTITATYLDRRIFHSQVMAEVRQAAVFMGTCNKPLHLLIVDETGNRRFLVLIYKEGDEEEQRLLWSIVNNIDFTLLWRSVSEDDPDPLAAVDREVRRIQAEGSPVGMLRNWCEDLDLKRPAIRDLETSRGFVAVDVFEQFRSDSPDCYSSSTKDYDRFLKSMKKLIQKREAGPFVDLDRGDRGVTFRVTMRE
jgi:hypothetical protein